VCLCGESSEQMLQFLQETSSMRELHLVPSEIGEAPRLRAADFGRIVRAICSNPYIPALSVSGEARIPADSIQTLLHSIASICARSAC
jgi:hypothetical protein